MKTFLAIAATLLVSSSALAFDFPNFPSQYPTKSGWAIGMTNAACNTSFNQRQFNGTITRARRGVIYRVFNKRGKLVASAKARNTSAFSQKICTYRR